MTGNHPYHEVDGVMAVFRKIENGETHMRPMDQDISRILTDGVWAIYRECWTDEVTQRPAMDHVISRLRTTVHGPGLDGGAVSHGETALKSAA